MYIFIFGFTKVQLTERIFIIYNLKENRNIARNVTRNVARYVARNVATV